MQASHLKGTRSCKPTPMFCYSVCILARFRGEFYPCLCAHVSVSKIFTSHNTHDMYTHTHPHTLKYTPHSFLPSPGMEIKARTLRGWLEEMKTCLISTATNGDAALHPLCPLIGLCQSLHLGAHVSASNSPPIHKWANPKTGLRGWGGMKGPRHGRSEGCSSGGEKKSTRSWCGVRRSRCVIINKALKKWAHQSIQGLCYRTWK